MISRKPSKQVPSTTVLNLAADLCRMPIKPSFISPIQPLEPPIDDSDLSQRTVHCVSDQISRDSYTGLVWKDCKEINLHNPNQVPLLVQRSRRSQLVEQKPSARARVDAIQWPKSAAPPSVATKEKTSNIARVLAELRRRGIKFPDGDTGKRRRRRHVERHSSDIQSSDHRDTSELLQLLTGRAYGTDCQRLRDERKHVDVMNGACGNGGGITGDVSVNFNESPKESNRDAAETAAATLTAMAAGEAGDRSELMTLTCGELSKSLMTHLFSVPTSIDEKQRCLCAAGATATVTSSAITVATVAAPRALRSSRRSEHRPSAPRSTHSSSMSVVGSDMAGASLPMTSVANDIPTSERIARSSVSGREAATPEGEDKGTDKGTFRSGLVIDLGDVFGDCRSRNGGGGDCNCRDCSRCSCKARRRCRHVRRRRCGQLHTPDMSQWSVGRSYSSSCCCGTWEAATETAALVEWSEALKGATNSDRHQIESSEDEECAESCAGRRKRSQSESGRKQATPPRNDKQQKHGKQRKQERQKQEKERKREKEQKPEKKRKSEKEQKQKQKRNKSR